MIIMIIIIIMEESNDFWWNKRGYLSWVETLLEKLDFERENKADRILNVCQWIKINQLIQWKSMVGSKEEEEEKEEMKRK